MKATHALVLEMKQGVDWCLRGNREAVRDLLGGVYDERFRKASPHKERFQVLEEYLELR